MKASRIFVAALVLLSLCLVWGCKSASTDGGAQGGTSTTQDDKLDKMEQKAGE